MASTFVSYTGKGGIQRIADFDQAAQRHLSDANVLLNQNCPDNSCYHSGYAAECAVKLVLLLTHLKWYRHLHELIPLIQGAAATIIDVNSIRQMQLCAHGSGWSPEMRYDPSGISVQQAQHWLVEATGFCHTTKVKLIADGVL